MLIQMTADRFGASGTLYTKGTQYDLAADLAFRFIGDGVAFDVGTARESQEGGQLVPVKLNKVTGVMEADGAPVSGAGIPASMRFCIPGRNPNTAFSDVSGLGADLSVEPANSGAFATADYFSSIAGTDSGLTIAAAKTVWTPATQSLVLAFVLKKAAPGANQNLLSWGGHTSGANIGFYVSHRTSGSLKIVPIIAGAVVNAQPDSTLSFSDGTPQDRHCLIAYDAPSGSWYMYRDGVLSNAWTNAMTGGNAYPANTPTITGVRWGGTSGTGATVVAASGYGLQGYLWTGGLPSTVGVGAQLMAANLSATARAPLNSLVA